MKKAVVLLLAVALALSALSLGGCALFKDVDLNEVKTSLEEAGYKVTVMTGKEYIESDDDRYPNIMEFELDNYLYAEKENEKIELFFFTSVDNASNNYDFMFSDLPKSGQYNNVLYFATAQAKKDAKI